MQIITRLLPLLPGVEKPEVDYKAIMGALGAACADMGLQACPAFLEKAIQLHETTLVRLLQHVCSL